MASLGADEGADGASPRMGSPHLERRAQYGAAGGSAASTADTAYSYDDDGVDDGGPQLPALV